MNKIFTVFFCLFLFVSSVFADCSNQTPPFDASPAEVVKIVTEWFGPPEKVTVDLIRWAIPEAERSSFAVIFVEGKLSGTLIFTVAKRSSPVAESFLKLAGEWEGSLTEEGFVFAKNGKDDSHRMKAVYKEYECKSDRRVRVRLALGKDMDSDLISAELYTYWDGNKEK